MTYEDKENSGVCVIRGDLKQILQAQQLLEKYIEERKACTDDCLSGLWEWRCRGIPRKTSDKGVMCDIIKLGKLSHFAMEHPRQARFSSLVLRQAASRHGMKEKFRFHRKTIKRKKVLSSSYSDKRSGLSINNPKFQVVNVRVLLFKACCRIIFNSVPPYEVYCFHRLICQTVIK